MPYANVTPEGLREINYLGDQWDRYKGPYRPRHEPSKKQARRVIEIARLVHRAKDEEFKELRRPPGKTVKSERPK